MTKSINYLPPENKDRTVYAEGNKMIPTEI
jgi:hypothetical protein